MGDSVAGQIAQAGGVTLSDAWIHVADLVAVGLLASPENGKDAAGEGA